MVAVGFFFFFWINGVDMIIEVEILFYYDDYIILMRYLCYFIGLKTKIKLLMWRVL